MNDLHVRPDPKIPRYKTILPAVAILLSAIFILLALSACRSQGAFRTIPEQLTPRGSFVGSPQPVSLPELAANPAVYQGRLIRVSGQFMAAETGATCTRNMRGPAGRWFLVADDWQLTVSGYAGIVARLEPGTTITIDGIFTYYVGPLGCGKGAPRDSLWYLNAIQIVEPNPLLLIAGSEEVEFANLSGDPAMGGTITVTAPVSATPIELTPTPTEPNPTGEIPSLTPTQPVGTVPAGTQTTGTATATSSPAATATPTPTAPSTSQTPQPTATPDGSPTQVPPSPTPTPEDGYPPPQATSTPTLSPYP